MSTLKNKLYLHLSPGLQQQ